MEESKRIKLLKKEMIKSLPFFPNNRSTLENLEEQGLSDVLIHYLHWRSRIVPNRRRKVVIAPTLTNDKRWKKYKESIRNLLEKVRQGEDIYPYHSKMAHKYGYTPIKRNQNGIFSTWQDKDQILNTKGFHHFHLDMRVHNTGLSYRTDDVLFAFVSRKKFHAIGIFDHSVFDTNIQDGSMSSERARMWKLHEKHVTAGMEPGAVYISNPIMSSGHPMYLVRMADFYARIITEHDPKLDDSKFLNSLYSETSYKPPKNPKFRWIIDNLDLMLLEKKKNILFCFYKGNI